MRSCDMETQSVRAMTHPAYRPPLPAGNKYLQQKWDKASYELHREKVKSVKPTIDTSTPKIYNHLALKLKKHQLDEELTAKIQRENNMLREKISQIMVTTGRVDNWNFYDKKSLGEERRQLELMRITEENQMILFRLSQCRTHYSMKSWNKDWLETLKLMDSIACFPRGRTNKPKGQEKSVKKCSDFVVEPMKKEKKPTRKMEQQERYSPSTECAREIH